MEKSAEKFLLRRQNHHSRRRSHRKINPFSTRMQKRVFKSETGKRHNSSKL